MDFSIHIIHRGSTCQGTSMAAKRKYAQLAEVSVVGAHEPKYASMPAITFTSQDLVRLHFSHYDILVIKLTIARCHVRRILINTGSLMDVTFQSILRNMKFDEAKIKKINMNLVGFNGKPSDVVGKVTMRLSTREVIVYSTMMVVDFESAYNAILR